MAVDWISGNVYLGMRRRQRIIVCNTSSLAKSQCAELFGNQVGSSIGGLALDPNSG